MSEKICPLKEIAIMMKSCPPKLLVCTEDKCQWWTTYGYTESGAGCAVTEIAYALIGMVR